MRGCEEVDLGCFSPRLLLCLGLWEDLCSFVVGFFDKWWTMAWIRRWALPWALDDLRCNGDLDLVVDLTDLEVRV